MMIIMWSGSRFCPAWALGENMISIKAKLEDISFRHHLIRRTVHIRKGRFRVFAWHPISWHLKDACPLSWMLDRIAADEVFFDIGANRGYYALSVLSNVPKARIYAFEPNPIVFRMLEDNIALNGHLGQVQAVPFALGERSGTSKLFISKSDSASSFSLSHSEIFGNGIEKALEVGILTIDGLVHGGDLPVPRHMKIDTEGFEVPILKGAQEVLRNHAPILYLEIHSEDGRTDNEEEIRSILRPQNYRMVKEGRFLLGLPERPPRS